MCRVESCRHAPYDNHKRTVPLHQHRRGGVVQRTRRPRMSTPTHYVPWLIVDAQCHRSSTPGPRELSKNPPPLPPSAAAELNVWLSGFFFTRKRRYDAHCFGQGRWTTAVAAVILLIYESMSSLRPRPGPLHLKWLRASAEAIKGFPGL